jgi:hypothetical protein
MQELASTYPYAKQKIEHFIQYTLLQADADYAHTAERLLLQARTLDRLAAHR